KNEGESQKNKIRQGSCRSHKKLLLGEVLLRDVSKKIHVKDQKVYNVAFKRGARTKLHYHEEGQLLFLTEGNGRLVFCKRCSNEYGSLMIRGSSKSRIKIC